MALMVARSRGDNSLLKTEERADGLGGLRGDCDGCRAYGRVLCRLVMCAVSCCGWWWVDGELVVTGW